MLVENVAEIKGVCGDWLLSDIRLPKVFKVTPSQNTHGGV
jgi:hypothetical protein